MQITIGWASCVDSGENELPKRVIAVVQATVTHTLSPVPVRPKYGFPPDFELNIEVVVRGGTGVTRIYNFWIHPPMDLLTPLAR